MPTIAVRLLTVAGGFGARSMLRWRKPVTPFTRGSGRRSPSPSPTGSSAPSASTLRALRHQRTITGSFTPMWIASAPTSAQASAKCVSRKRNGCGYHWKVSVRPVASCTNDAATSSAIAARSSTPPIDRTGGHVKSSG